MKTVHYRGVLVVFQISDHWVEEHEKQGGGTFYDPNDPSVTLRLNVMTLSPPRDMRADEAVSALQILGSKIAGSIESLPNGQAIAAGVVERASERGTPIELYSLFVARVVPPRTIRLASFVTTIVPSESHAAVIERKLDVIYQVVRACTISDAPPQQTGGWWKRLTGQQ